MNKRVNMIVDIFSVAKMCWKFIEEYHEKLGIKDLYLMPPNVTIKNIKPPKERLNFSQGCQYSLASFELSLDDSEIYPFSTNVVIYPHIIREYIRDILKDRVSDLDIIKLLSYVILHEYFHYIDFTTKYMKSKFDKNEKINLENYVNTCLDEDAPLISQNDNEDNANENLANHYTINAFDMLFLSHGLKCDFDRYLYYYGLAMQSKIESDKELAMINLENHLKNTMQAKLYYRCRVNQFIIMKY